MRHRVKVKKLNRSQGHYRATISSLAGALIEHKQIKTTLPKAKELRPYIEKLITHAKTDDVHKRRVVYRKLKNRQLIFELFTVIGPQNADRDGGYTRILKLGKRRGDGTEMAIIQLIGFEAFDQTSAKKKTAKKKTVKEDKPLLKIEDDKAAVEEKSVLPKEEVVEEKESVAEEVVATDQEATAEPIAVSDSDESNVAAEEISEAEVKVEEAEVKAEQKSDEESKADSDSSDDKEKKANDEK